MQPFNIFMWNSEFEQKIARDLIIGVFEIYVDQLIKMIDDNEYTINNIMKN